MIIPDYSVKGKVTVVTGSSQGIGNALARGFAAAGAPVVLVARTASLLENTAGEIESQGGKALAVPADVTDGAQVSRMVERTMDVFGRIDVLINCAGGSASDRFTNLLDMDELVWDRVVDRNLRSAYLCCRAVGRVMVEQRSGSVINFSSGSARHPQAGMTHYCASKAGIDMFTKALSLEWGRHNVRVNAISPGLTDTPGERSHMPAEMMQKISGAVALGRIGQPEDMLATAIFLASGASSYITGVIIPVGGGPQ